MDKPVPDEVRRFCEGLGCRVGKPIDRATFESCLPSRSTIALVILGTLAFTALELGRGMRKTVVGTRRSYERLERLTDDGYEVYERFEESTMLIQRG